MNLTSKSVRFASHDDAEKIYSVLMHDSVRPGFFHEGVPPLLDTVEGVKRIMELGSIWIIWNGGLFLVVPVLSGTAEVHVAVLPRWRGPKALRAAQAAIDLVFTSTPYSMLVGSTRVENKPALSFLNAVGFKTLRTDNNRCISNLSLMEWSMRKRNVRDFAMDCASGGQIEKSAFVDAIYRYTSRRMR